MPEMGGRELAEQLRAARSGIRVLFMSGYTDHKIGRDGVLDGDAVFLQKPFSGTALSGAVRATLDQARRS